MQLGMIGLGRNMAARLMRVDHECIVYDSHPEPVQELVKQGAKGSTSLTEFAKSLAKPRAVWLMVPTAAVDPVLASLTSLLEPGDVVADGGNSYYHDDIRRAAQLKVSGLHYVDVGASGGVLGLERGYYQMIGGEPEIVQHLDPIFRALAPGVAAAPRTPGATGEPKQAECGNPRIKHPGEGMEGQDVELILTEQESAFMPPYQLLLGDAMHGIGDLFGRQDIVDAQRRIVEPVLDDVVLPVTYEQGSRGPEEANELIGPDGPWHNPKPTALRP